MFHSNETRLEIYLNSDSLVTDIEIDAMES